MEYSLPKKNEDDYMLDGPVSEEKAAKAAKIISKFTTVEEKVLIQALKNGKTLVELMNNPSELKITKEQEKLMKELKALIDFEGERKYEVRK